MRSRGFLFSRLDCVLFISIQPFVYVVGNYTSQHGDKETKYIHSDTSFLPEVTQQIDYIILESGEEMKRVFNSIKGILFLLLGIILVLIPYSQFKELFSAAPAPIVIRILGAVIILCGIAILAAAFMSKK